MRSTEKGEPAYNTYEQLEAMLRVGVDRPGAVLDRKIIPAALASDPNLEVDRLVFPSGRLVVGIRRYVDRLVGDKPDRDIRVMLVAANPDSGGLDLEYQNGFKERTVGGAFVVEPGGAFSNSLSLGWPCREHGPLTQESQDMLIQLALGATLLADPS